jgi:multiple sugar transport system ATP-binding protein
MSWLGVNEQMQATRPCALRLEGVSKSYGRVTALDNLSFEVEEGRFFALFGPSSVGGDAN